MHKYIKDQLNKCQVAKVPEFTDATTQIIINKYSDREGVGVVQNKFYLIEFDDYILHPYEGFTLHDNWNKGIVPTDKRMKVRIEKVMGDMILIQGVGETDFKAWAGWIPRKSMKVLGEL